jgi:sialic acid synthase SpsE/RimJ/RimL family protein N-acetyltransferase
MPDNITFEICRPVEAHARLVMEWRNDPATLAMFFHRNPKQWDSFWPEFRAEYFASDPEPLFILNNGKRAGFVRFKTAPHPRGLHGRCVDISINLAPDERGRGLGRGALCALEPVLVRAGVDTIYAVVRQKNEASRRMFASAGYEEVESAVHTVEDTGEKVQIARYLRELSSTFWRRNHVTVIAEAGSNWRVGQAKRDRAMARALIDVATEAGADVVKFQTYRPETVYVPNAGGADYLADTDNSGDISTIFADLAMPYEMIGEMADYCAKNNIGFMSTGFSPADFQAIDPYVQIHKVASYEIGHVRLIDLAAASGKPLILSTGASDYADIHWAVERFHQQGGRDLCLLQCTAKYPAPLSTLNVLAMTWLRRRFGVTVGLSDHSRDPVVGPVAAIALGARCIEKHFTLHNALPGPDHPFAVAPMELVKMVRRIREAEMARGAGEKLVLEEEDELAAFAKRGLQAIRPIKKSEILRENENFAILRPGKQAQGAHPRYADEAEGCKAVRDIPLGDGIRVGDWS